ncbi:SDR family oxidoreductase [Deinococcus oregonensis]|uniref:SDR family oxidoreductase n=1 Tax=Deinococcus oregonensis TaxID=1805970 RepID=A0ABV6AUG4_9DEIO
MILVTGATGQLGRSVVEALLNQIPADQIAVLVRDEAKATTLREQGVSIRVGSYDDTASLERAMQGIDRVLLIAGTDEEKRVEQHRNVIRAAKQAGVSCLAYTSRTLKDRTTMVNKLMEGHFQTEEDLQASGLGYAIFRNVLYMDTLVFYVGERGLKHGFRLPTGQGRVAYALRSEMGEALANWLVSGPCENKIYKLTGSEASSFDDVARVLTELTGNQVTYTPVEDAEFEAQLKARGVPETLIPRYLGFQTDIKNGQEDETTAELAQLLERRPATLREGLKVLFSTALV